MAKFSNQLFGPDEEVQLDGNEFINCEFIGARIVYGGGAVPVVKGCDFERARFNWVGAAENTFRFLAELGASQGGDVLIDTVLRNIRERNFPVRDASRLGREDA